MAAVGSSTNITEAFVSLTTNDDYSKGAFVLGKSLKNSGTKRKCVLMVTSGVTATMRSSLSEVWDDIIDITLLDSNDKENLALLARPELGCTFSKLRAWTLIQFVKCVFLDADTLVLQNIDELFQREELSAAADVGWPDCFNSGVFVFKPSLSTYDKLIEYAKTRGSFDGGDQGLLNDFFGDWASKDISRHLPFTYNMVANICYSYAPAFMRYGQDVKVVHFLGSVKPWHHSFDKQTGRVTLLPTSKPSASDQIFNQMWWDLFNASSTADPSSVSPSQVASEVGMPPSWQSWTEVRTTAIDKRTAWERGSPDYQGEDRFDNIINHMSAMMLKTKPEADTKTKAVSAETETKPKTVTTTTPEVEKDTPVIEKDTGK